MAGPFLGSEWDDREWFRSSRWNDEIARDFEARLKRSRSAHTKYQYVRIQGTHLCAQSDPDLREAGRSLFRRVIVEDPGGYSEIPARHGLARSLALDGCVDEAVAEFLEARRRVEEVQSTGSGGVDVLDDTDVLLAEMLIARDGAGDRETAAALLDQFTVRSESGMAARDEVVRYLLARRDLARDQDDRAAEEWLAAAMQAIDEPAMVTRPEKAFLPIDASPAEALAAIVAEVAPVLKVAGFRKRRHSFNRTAGDGMTHVVSFQAGPSDPPGHSESSILPSLHGLFAVNLSVHVPGMRAEERRSVWVNEYDGNLRVRLGELVDERGRDVWWISRHPAAAADVLDGLQRRGLPWLAQFPDVDSVLEVWLSGDRQTLGSIPVRAFEIAPVLIQRGRTAEAEAALLLYLREPMNRHHRAYLAELLPTLGLAHLIVELPPLDG